MKGDKSGKNYSHCLCKNCCGTKGKKKFKKRIKKRLLRRSNKVLSKSI